MTKLYLLKVLFFGQFISEERHWHDEVCQGDLLI